MKEKGTCSELWHKFELSSGDPVEHQIHRKLKMQGEYLSSLDMTTTWLSTLGLINISKPLEPEEKLEYLKVHSRDDHQMM